jgi:hypothetical protein
MESLSASPTVTYECEDPDLKYTPGRPPLIKINRYAPPPDLGSFYLDLSSLQRRRSRATWPRQRKDGSSHREGEVPVNADGGVGGG